MGWFHFLAALILHGINLFICLISSRCPPGRWATTATRWLKTDRILTQTPHVVKHIGGVILGWVHLAATGILWACSD